MSLFKEMCPEERDSEDSRKWLSHPKLHLAYTRAARKRGEWIFPCFPLLSPVISF